MRDLRTSVDVAALLLLLSLLLDPLGVCEGGFSEIAQWERELDFHTN